MAWTLREHKKEPDRLAHLLYWQQLRGQDVVYQNDHSLLSVLAYRGPDMESADAHELMALRSRLHANMVMPLDAGWMLQAEERRHAAAPYPVSTWAHPAAALMDEERRAEVGTPGTHFETSYHLSCTRQLPRRQGTFWRRMWWENIPQGHAHASALTQFRDDLARLQGQAAAIFEEAELLTNAALMTYLKSTASAHDQAYVGVPEPPWHLNYQLSDSALQPGVTPYLGDKLWLRPVVVKNEQRQVAFPDVTYPGILDCLHDLPMEYRFVVRWIPLSYSAAMKELNDLENIFRGGHKSFGTQMGEKWRGQDSGKVEESADNDAAQMSAARAMLEDGVCKFGYVTMTVVVWDEELAIAEEKQQAVCQALRSKGFLASVEMIDAVGAWLGTIPGDSYHNVEKPMLSSLTFVDLMPTTSVWAGPKWVPHLNGPAVLVGTARGQTPFRLTTHEGDVGDFILVGPKGSGKSATASDIACGWQRYTQANGPDAAPTTPQVFPIDKGQSLKAATLAMDGLWVNLVPHSTRPLQPLARIDDPEELSWGVELLEDMLEMEGFRREPDLNGRLTSAMKSLADFPVSMRTLSGFRGLVMGSQIQEALERYCLGGQFPLLDGDEDWLQMARWTCFEMETLLDDFPRFVPPVSKVIFRRIEKALDGNPTLIWIDEAHAHFAQEALAKRELSWLKTFRRKNAILGFGTQNPWDLKRSPVGLELVQACPTRLFCANPHAVEPKTMELYHEEFGLTPRQCQIIATLLPKRELYYQGQQGCRRFRLDMGPVTLAFNGRSRQRDLAKMDVVDRERTEPFGIAWLRAEGLDMQADLLGEAYEEPKDTVDRYYADTDLLTAVDES